MSKKKKQEKLKAEKTYKIAENILKHLGGKENVMTVMNCATRLKFGLIDDKKADVGGMNGITAVKGMFYSNNMWQVATGMGAEEICRDVKSLCYDMAEEPKSDNLKKIFLRILIIATGFFALLAVLLKISGYDLSVIGLSDLISDEYKKFLSNTVHIKYIDKVVLTAAGGGVIGILTFWMLKVLLKEKEDVSINDSDYNFTYDCVYDCKEVIYSPVRGRVISFKDTESKEFADEVFGKGYAVLPEANLITSPCDGKVTAVSKMKNAFCITSDTGVEILMHIGIDTAVVESFLNQEFFTAFVSEGENIRMGVPIAEFNAENLKAAGFDITVFISIVNSSDYNEVTCVSEYAVDQKPFIKLF